MMKTSSVLFASLVMLVLSFSSCTTYSNVTANASTRRQMLQTKLTQFHRQTTRGQFDIAIESVSKDAQETFISKLEREKKKERVVEKEVDDVVFNEQSDAATVSVLVRFFKQPGYVVLERKESEEWAYDTTEGWKWIKAEKVDGTEKPTTLSGTL